MLVPVLKGWRLKKLGRNMDSDPGVCPSSHKHILVYCSAGTPDRIIPTSHHIVSRFKD